MGAISVVMQYGTEKQKRLGGRPRSVRRQAGDPHHRAASRIGRDRDDDARRQARQQLYHPRQEALDHGRRNVELRMLFARVFDERGEEQGIGGFHALGGTPGLIIGKREAAMASAAPSKRKSFSRTWRSLKTCWYCRGADLGVALQTSSMPITASVSAPKRPLGARTGCVREGHGVREVAQAVRLPDPEFQGLQWMLADMAVAFNAARLSLHQAVLSAVPFPDPLLAA
jgi:hypothetical protein